MRYLAEVVADDLCAPILGDEVPGQQADRPEDLVQRRVSVMRFRCSRAALMSASLAIDVCQAHR